MITKENITLVLNTTRIHPGIYTIDTPNLQSMAELALWALEHAQSCLLINRVMWTLWASDPQSGKRLSKEAIESINSTLSKFPQERE